jgi:hypothetical protein
MGGNFFEKNGNGRPKKNGKNGNGNFRPSLVRQQSHLYFKRMEKCIDMLW